MSTKPAPLFLRLGHQGLALGVILAMLTGGVASATAPSRTMSHRITGSLGTISMPSSIQAAPRLGAGLHWDTRMPPSTQRHHESPRRGGAQSAIRRTSALALGRDGIRAIDMDFSLVDGVALSLHSNTPRRSGYSRYVDPSGHLRKMTRAQARMRASAWGVAGIQSWRRPNGDRPLTYAAAVRYAVARGVVICAELKSRTFASVQVMSSLVADSQRADHPAWFMALLNMKNAKGKSHTVRAAGGQFALIFGRFRSLTRHPPRNWSTWTKPAQIWGPARAKRWLLL